MSEFKSNYYKQIVDKYYNDLMAEDESENTISSLDREVLCRNLISRAYYCSLLYCKHQLSPIIGRKGVGSHELIIGELGDYYTSLLDRLRAQRVKADYKTNPFITRKVYITKLVEQMKEICLANEHDLKNKRSY